MFTLKYFAMRNTKYKSDKKIYNNRCRMTCADGNLKVSFELIQWIRKKYG
jgi:hypothetical protein